MHNMVDNIQSYTSMEESILKRNEIIKDRLVIDDLGDHLYLKLKNIEGFDFRWSSLITSKPLLFEDMDYIKILPYVNNTTFPIEVEAYKKGDLRKIYPTFEYMLMDNLMYYDRIIRFCTITFLHYIRENDDNFIRNSFDDLPYYLDMTPTQIWCCAMSSTESTRFELEYAWNIKKLKEPKSEDISYLQTNWDLLYEIKLFSKFMEASAYINETNGFRETYIKDKTNNKKHARICKKFTNTSVAVSEESLITIFDYIQEQDIIHQRLYTSLYTCLMKMFDTDSEFAIYIFTNEFYLHTSKFSMRVTKSEDGKISKDYLGNTIECFAAEEYLVDSIKYQIEWAKYKLPNKFQYDKNILKNFLYNMLKDDFKDTICVKRMNDFGVTSKIIFRGVFNNLYIVEQFLLNNRIIKETRICLSKKNTAKYIIERGYSIFGNEKDILELMLNEKLTNQLVIDHYRNYCVIVINYMKDIIEAYNIHLNEIIDVICNDFYIHPTKLSNTLIRYSNIHNRSGKDYSLARELMSKALQKQTNSLEKKSYWKIRNEE